MRNARADEKVFWISLVLVGAVCAPLLAGPERGLAILGGMLVWPGAGKHGRAKFGGPDARPHFSTPAWVAMIFSPGIGGGSREMNALQGVVSSIRGVR